MGTFYVRSTNGSDSNNGSSWAQAKQTITGALNACSPGDLIYVSQAHDYYVGGNIIYPSKGSVTNPVVVVCVNDSVQPPNSLATTASENNISSTNDVTFSTQSYIHWYGINFKSSRNIYFPPNSMGSLFERCFFQTTSSTQGNMYVYGGSLCSYNTLRFINTTFSFTWTGSSFQFNNNWNWLYHTSNNWWTGILNWMMNTSVLLKGCLFIGASVVSLFNIATSNLNITLTAENCDLSLLGSQSSLIGQPNNAMPPSKFYFRNCKLSSTASLFDTGLTYAKRPDVYFDNCDAGSNNLRNEVYKFQGNMSRSTTVWRTGGANNGNNGYSYVLSSNLNTSFTLPIDSAAISMWCGQTNIQKTVTVSFVHDSTSTIGPNDIWADLEYQGNSSAPISSFASTKSSTYPLFIGGGTGIVDDSTTWTTPGLVNSTFQKFQFQFTPRIPGLLVVKVYLAKPNYTVYIDPMIVLS